MVNWLSTWKYENNPTCIFMNQETPKLYLVDASVPPAKNTDLLGCAPIPWEI